MRKHHLTKRILTVILAMILSSMGINTAFADEGYYETEHQHTPGEVVVEYYNPPSCYYSGSQDNVVYCTSCGAELSRETISLGVLNHIPGGTVIENEIAPTCSSQGQHDEVVYCTECGGEISRITVTDDVVAHTPGEATRENEVAATCTSDGSYDEVVRCAACGNVISSNRVSIPAAGHVPGEPVEENKVEPTCTEDGSHDIVIRCTVCGEVISSETVTDPATGHKWDEGKVTTEASASEEGEKTFTCTVCGETKTEFVEKLEAATVVFTSKAEDDVEPLQIRVYKVTSGVISDLIEAELDGSYLLVPGDYIYSVEMEGYDSIENELLKIESTDVGQILTIEVKLVATEGYCGKAPYEKRLSWKIDEDGKLTITREMDYTDVTDTYDETGELSDAAMEDYEVEEDESSKTAPWYDKRDEIKTIEISEGVASIGEYAFQGLENLETIKLPESLTTIGKFALSGCGSLREVVYAGSESQWRAITVEESDLEENHQSLTEEEYQKQKYLEEYILDENKKILEDETVNYTFEKVAAAETTTTIEDDPAETETLMPAFEPAPVNIDGVIITVSAPEGVFPEGSSLSVTKVSASELRRVDAAVEEQRDENVNVASSYTYDIKVLYNGEEIQPADGLVSVSFALAEVADQNLDTNVYHVSEDEVTGELEAEVLDVVEEDSGEESVVTVLTDGFSYFTVEFTYNDLEYVIPGQIDVYLSVVLRRLNIWDTPDVVKFSDDTLFDVSKTSDDRDWIIYCKKAFNAPQTMTITIDEQDYVITVLYPWADFNEKVENAESGDTITLSCDLYYSDEVGIIEVKDKAITVDLAGYDISLEGATDSGFRIKDGGSLTVVNTGKDVSWISECKADVAIDVEDGSFTLSDRVTITNNDDTGVHVGSEGTFNMEGGKISNHWNGVIVDGGGTFNMNGGSIFRTQTGVTAYQNSNIAIKGSPNITGNSWRNVYLYPGVKLNIAGPITEEASIGITMYDSSGVFTNGFSTHCGTLEPSDVFTGDNSTAVEWNEDKTEAQISIPYVDADDQPKGTEVCKTIKPETTTLDGGWYALNESTTVQSLSVTGNVNLILCAGEWLQFDESDELSKGIEVGEGSSLTIWRQSATGSGEIYNGYGNGITASGSVTINGGSVYGGHNGVLVSSGSLAMNNGKIEGQTYGVEVENDGIAVISKGEVEALHLNKGTITVTGGKVSADKSGVIVEDGTLNISGEPTIEYNKSPAPGRESAGVELRNGIFNLSGNPSFVEDGVALTGPDIELSSGKVIQVSDALSDSFTVNVSTKDQTMPVTITNGLGNKGSVSNFKSYNSSYVVGINAKSNEAMLAVPVTAKFNSNGGTGTMADQVIPGGVPTILNANQFTRTGYSFDSWNTQSDGSGEQYTADNPATITGDTTLYAQWKANKYTVTFVDEDGKTVLKPATEYDYGTPAKDIVKPADPTKQPTAQYTYTFAGWDPTVADVTGDATYKATYTSTVNEYTIQFVDEDGTVLQSGMVAFGDTPKYNGKTPTKAEDESYIYTFAGWTPAITTVTGDATYRATYTATKNVYYTCSEGTGQTYTQGSGSTLKFVFTRSKNDELTFDNFNSLKYDGKLLTKEQHYTAEKGSVKIELFNIVLKSASLGEHTLTAAFTDGDPVDVTFTVVAAGTHTVTFNANGHGTAPSAQTVQDGQTAKKPSDPTAEGYTFGGWYTDQACTTAFDFGTAITKDITLYAKWTATYVVTEGEGSKYSQGADGTLTFVFKRTENDKDTFSHFTGLKYDGMILTKDKHYTAKEGSVIIELQPSFLKSLKTGEHTLTAMFDDGDPANAEFEVVQGTTHTVTFNANGHGTAPSAQTVTDGQKATKPTNPTAEGYTFGGWYTDQTCTTAFDFNTAITKDITLYAKWTAGSSSSGQNGTNGSGSSGSSDGTRTSPSTGDTNNTGLWILLMVISLLVIGGVLIGVAYRKKRVK